MQVHSLLSCMSPPVHHHLRNKLVSCVLLIFVRVCVYCALCARLSILSYSHIFMCPCTHIVIFPCSTYSYCINPCFHTPMFHAPMLHILSAPILFGLHYMYMYMYVVECFLLHMPYASALIFQYFMHPYSILPYSNVSCSHFHTPMLHKPILPCFINTYFHIPMSHAPISIHPCFITHTSMFQSLMLPFPCMQ